jgi:hypothetical protein
VTEAGKQRAARNAVRHGLWAHGLSIMPGEDPAEWTVLHDDLFDEWAPLGIIEATLVNELMMTLWRLRRLARLEVERLKLGEGMIDGHGTPPTMALIVRYRRDLNKSLLDLTRELEARQAARGADPEADAARLDAAHEELVSKRSTAEASQPGLPAPAPPAPANQDQPEGEPKAVAAGWVQHHRR